MDKLEPQQPEGELVQSDTYRHSQCITPHPAQIMSKCCACVWDEAIKAQLAHDKVRIQTLEIDYQMLSEEAKGLSDENKELKATMVKLPSVVRIAEWLHSARFEWKSKWRDYKNKGQVGGDLYTFMAKALIKLLKGEAKPWI